jgi:peptidoglycan/LPS O-acetylase OafA/YrhL
MSAEGAAAERKFVGYDGAVSSLADAAAANAQTVARPAGRAALLQIPSLDGLRALSFLIVFVSHAGVSAVPGGFGVTVFFFLSGYLITTLMRQEVEQTGKVSFSQFYLRRALRILPPFYLVLTVATGLTALGLLPGQLEAAAVLSQVFHYCNYWFAVNGWAGIGSGTGVYWSLAVEEHFYFVFPALFMLLHRFDIRGRNMAIAFWTICLAVLAWRCVLVFALDAATHRVFVASDSRADSMLLGCALAVWKNPALDELDRPLSKTWTHLWLPAGLLLLLATFAVRSDGFRDTFRYSLQGIALYPIFHTAIRKPGWGPYKLLNSRVLRRVGLLSYSLYLVHHTVIDGLSPYLPDNVAVRLAVTLVCSVTIAQAMFVLVEAPCARLRKRLHTST